MENEYIVKAAAYCGAALVMCLGTIGPALAQGLIGSKACEMTGKYPESSNKVRLLMFVAIGVVESLGIYCLLIALLLIYR